MKFYIPNILFIVVLYSCKLHSVNNSNISVNVCSLKVTTLPFVFDKHWIQLDSLCNQEVNALFSDSTILHPPFLYTDHPNDLKGQFYKRLPDVGNHRVLLFVYFNGEWVPDGMNKSTTVELQIFDTNNRLIDKMIIADGVEGNCSWYRTFEVDEDYKINIKNKFSCIETNETKDLNQMFIINENGSIVEMFKLISGDYERCDKIPFLDLQWYSKGHIENYLKQKKWIECESVYDIDAEKYINRYIWSTYINGIKVSKPIIARDEDLEMIDCLSEK